MSCSISSIYYCPVKTLSFQNIETCNVKKDLGMTNDRIFAFSRGVDLEKAKSMEKNPNERKLNNLLTLKNSPALNKYNFTYNKNKLSLNLKEKELIAISTDIDEDRSKLSEKLNELESSLVRPIFLLNNNEFPSFISIDLEYFEQLKKENNEEDKLLSSKAINVYSKYSN